MLRFTTEGGTDSPVIALPFAAVSSPGVSVLGGQCALMGYSVVEVTGAAAATFDIIDGMGAVGPSLIPITLSAGQSRLDTWSSWGLAANSGLFVAVSAGAIRGTLYVVLPDRYPVG